MQTFEELLKTVKNPYSIKENTKVMGQSLAANLVNEVKRLSPSQVEARKELNKQRIKALGLTLIQGEKV